MTDTDWLAGMDVDAQVSRKVDLVYGGGSLGLMGEVSEAVHRGGGHVIGSVSSSCPAPAGRPFTASRSPNLSLCLSIILHTYSQLTALFFVFVFVSLLWPAAASYRPVSWERR